MSQTTTAILIVVLTILGMASELLGAPRVNAQRSYLINGVIGQGNLFPIGSELLRRSKVDRGEPVDLIISSPGGEVTTGFLFVSQMRAAQANGLVIRCFVPTFAASMAFHLLTQCNERYILDNSFLLWHRARIMLGGMFGAAMTGPELGTLAMALLKLDARIYTEVLRALQADPSKVKYHFEKETLHTGYDLARFAPKFAESYLHIPGLMESLSDPKIPRMNPPDSGEEAKKLPPRAGQIIYQAPARVMSTIQRASK